MDWCSKWKLDLNIEKCQILQITRKKRENIHNFDYTLDSINLEKVDSLKYLGVVIDNSLNWKHHVEVTAAKAMKRVRFIGRIFKMAGKEARIRAVNGLVRPILDYASAAWDPYRQTHINELEKVQRVAARMINGSYQRRGVCVTGLLNDLQWPLLCDRRREGRLRLFYKILQSKTILKPADRFQRPDFIGFRDHSRKLKLITSSSNYHRSSFYPRALMEWNEWPSS